jgi:hypothetical protein
LTCLVRTALKSDGPSWRFAPAELLAEFHRRRDGIPSAEFFNKPKYQRLREMWCAAKFGIGYETYVRPCAILWTDTDDRDVDATFEIDGKREPFQIVEVQPPGRRRGREYREQAHPITHDSEDFEAGGREGPRWIRDMIEKKARHYGLASHLHLLVYLNFNGRMLDPRRIRQEAADVAANFGSVWLVADHVIVSLTSSHIGYLKAWRKLPGRT